MKSSSKTAIGKTLGILTLWLLPYNATVFYNQLSSLKKKGWLSADGVWQLFKVSDKNGLQSLTVKLSLKKNLLSLSLKKTTSAKIQVGKKTV